MVLNKKQMTEEDIKLHYITPAIQVKWGPYYNGDKNHLLPLCERLK